MNSPALPVVLDKHTVLGAIGRGGMADVYLAMAHGPSGVRKLVVIKRMRAGNEVDSTLARMFLDEGRVAALLSHANVVHTYEVGESRDGAYIVMEYLHGQTLSALWRAQKPLPPAVGARIAADVLAGLHHAHELCDLDGTPVAMVHRDLSPPNIFVTYDGVVKVMDFGIAKTAIATRASTETGLVKGKLAYMAPEQATCGVVDRRADIYAVGVVLWELLAGRRLVEDLSPASILERSLHGSAPLVSSVRADIEPALDRIVARALAREPEARYATALEMREALEEVLERGPATGARELSRLMAQHFTAQREQRELQIKTWAAACTPNEPELEVITRPVVLEEPPPERSSGGTPPSTHVVALRPRRRLAPAVVLAGVLLLSLTAFAFYSNEDPAPGRSPAESASTASSAAVPLPTPVASAAPITPEPVRAVAHAPRADSPPSAPLARSRAAPARSSAKAALTAPVAAPAAALPVRPSQSKEPASLTLESNPYLHSQ